jgi:aspartate/methionine/tyrosine aminotransferase
MKLPLPETILKDALRASNIADAALATIRQTGDIARYMERESETEFIHLEMGIPGLRAEEVGVRAEIGALEAGVASLYPPIPGIPALKHESSRFIKAFLDIEVAPAGCVPTVGSMQGTFTAFMLAGSLDTKKDTILFVDPGFPVQRVQTRIMGIRSESFDIYEYRGEKLRAKLEEYFAGGNIAAIVYSNPNNPAWICFTEDELRIIGELATRYDVIVMEDLAYMGMDFRTQLGRPFEPPYQPTVAKYTDNYMLFISASKIFSYAGQRIGIVAISDKLREREYPALGERFGMTRLGDAYIISILYGASSGTGHAAQYALTAMFKAASDGELDFVGHATEYARRAARTKEMFLRHGFHIVYDKDMDEAVGDGFFYTVGYKDMTSGELMQALLLHGICAITLTTTGSLKDGVRICVSQLNEERQFTLLEERLANFN